MLFSYSSTLVNPNSVDINHIWERYLENILSAARRAIPMKRKKTWTPVSSKLRSALRKHRRRMYTNSPTAFNRSLLNYSFAVINSVTRHTSVLSLNTNAMSAPKCKSALIVNLFVVTSEAVLKPVLSSLRLQTKEELLFRKIKISPMPSTPFLPQTLMFGVTSNIVRLCLRRLTLSILCNFPRRKRSK